jgi:LacI family transcriptional regulator
MATIKDVAKMANVSVATVSRYINNNGYVGLKSKEAIEQAIRALDYKPNLIARSLSTKQMQTIGLIVPDIMNPFFPELARAIEDTALIAGYTVILCNSDEQAEKEMHYIESLQQKYIAGFIIASNQLTTEQYCKLNVPIVLLDRVFENELPSVTSNNHLGAEIATNYLLTRNVKELAFFSGPKNLEPMQQRLTGFKQAVAKKNIKTHIFESLFDFLHAEQSALDALSKYPSIDAVFASSDVIAMGVLKAAHKLGIRVPDELQVIGFDGIAMGEIVTPSLTTIAQNIYALGEAATQMLVKQIKGQPLNEKHITIEPKLIVRGTTKE